MRITSVQPLRGPNLWSNSVPFLIQVKLDFSAEKNWTAEKVQELFDLAKGNLPFLKFNSQINTAQNLTLITVNLAIYLQTKVGFQVQFVDYKFTIVEGVYNAVFEYENEKIGVKVIGDAASIINSILEEKDIEIVLNQYIQALINKKNAFNNDLQKLIEVCKKNQIPYFLPDEDLSLHIGYGSKGVDVFKDQYASTLLNLSTQLESLKAASIPIIAITGSNGKTTTTRLIAHILQTAKYKVGFTTSDGIYVDGKMIDKGDTTGPYSAQLVLRNTIVDVAVLESARGGIVRAGLGFKHCDIGIVTNVQNDHLGIADIETMEALANVKQVIVNAVKLDGYAVLNADNAYTLQMGSNAKCKVAWFTTNESAVILNNEKATLLFVSEGKVYFQKENIKTFIIDVNHIPITFNGSIDFMTQNALAAILACLLFGIEPLKIAEAVSSFFPSEAQTPGRMNIYQFKNCKVMVDFAHNPEGFMGIANYLQSIKSTCKIGIIVGTGDRKDEDIMLLGKIAASMFDHILIHQVKFLRGQTAEQIVTLLVDGMKQENPQVSWQRVKDEDEPLLFALQMISTKPSMIVALSDVLDEPPTLIKKYQKQY